MALAEKPILRGEAIIKYEINNTEYPQIHNILYYVDKHNPAGPNPLNPQDDPQFENWEEGLMEWLKTNIPDFNRYNQTPPGLSTDSGNEQIPTWKLPIFFPKAEISRKT